MCQEEKSTITDQCCLSSMFHDAALCLMSVFTKIDDCVDPAAGWTRWLVLVLVMALFSFLRFDTSSLHAQGGQCRNTYFNILRDISPEILTASKIYARGIIRINRLCQKESIAQLPGYFQNDSQEHTS